MKKMLIRFYNWYGGKIRVVTEITSLIPQHITSWYEACAGSGAVTLNKARHSIEVLNDLDREIVNLFTIMADRKDGANLLDRLLTIKHSKAEFICAKRAQQNNYKGIDRFRMAELTYILITQSFNAERISYANGIKQCDYRFSMEKNLPWVYKRLKGVFVKNIDAIDLVNNVRNNRNAFVFLDVPYLHTLRAKNSINVYGYEMSTNEHIRMLEVIRDAKCCIMLCGYRHKEINGLYDRYLLPNGWKHYKLADLVKSCQRKQIKDVAEEWVWLNYKPPETSKYFINHSSTEW